MALFKKIRKGRFKMFLSDGFGIAAGTQASFTTLPGALSIDTIRRSRTKQVDRHLGYGTKHTGATLYHMRAAVNSLQYIQELMYCACYCYWLLLTPNAFSCGRCFVWAARSFLKHSGRSWSTCDCPGAAYPVWVRAPGVFSFWESL